MDSTPNDDEHEPGALVVPLPAPWRSVATLNQRDSQQLESALGIDLTAQDGRYKGQYRWDRLVNEQTSVTVFIRIHAPTEGRATISAITFVSPDGDTSITQQDMRAFPVAAISDAYVREQAEGDYFLRAAMVAGDFDRSEPLGRPDGTDRFYARVAQQFRYLEHESSEAPARAMAALNGIGGSTAQRWITEARNRHFLAPGKPGRRVGRGGA